MASQEEIDAARRELARRELARRELARREAARAAAERPPALDPGRAAEAVAPLELPEDFLSRVRTEAAETAARDVKQFGDLPSPVVEARRAATEQALIDEAIRSRGTVLTPARAAGAGIEPAPGPVTSAIPTLRPSRIRTLPTGEQVYIEPDTGVVRPPSDVERFVESFARQPIKSEREIIRESIMRSDLPSDEKKSRIERLDQVPESQLGPGEVEGTLSAALTPLSLGSAVVRDVFFGPTAREARAALNRAVGRELPEALVLPTPLPGAKQIDRPKTLEPEGAGMLGRVGAILSNRSETIGDEFRRTPVVVDRFKALGLSEEAAKDAAYALGFVTDVAVPTTLGAGPLAKVTGEAVGATRVGRAAGRAVEAATTATAPALRRAGLEGVTAVVGIGPAADAALVRRAAERVVNTAPDLTDAQRAAVTDAVARTATPDAIRASGPGWVDSVADEVEGAARAAGVDGDRVRAVGREVRRALPTAEPMVRVTDAVAVPRSIAPRVRQVMREILDAGPRAPLTGAEDAAALAAAGRLGREIADLRVADLAADDALRGSLLDRTLPALAESRILRRMAAMDPTRPSTAALAEVRKMRIDQKNAVEAFATRLRRGVERVGFDRAMDAAIKQYGGADLMPGVRTKIFGDLAESVAARIPDPEPTVEGILRYVQAARDAGIVRAPATGSRDQTIRAIVAAITEDAIPERLATAARMVPDAIEAVGRAPTPSVSALDRQVAAGGAELAKMVDELPVARQTALLPYLFDTVATPAQRQLRLLRQSIRYGIGPLPNLPYVGARLAAATVLPIAAIGARMAGAGAVQAVRGGPLRVPGGVLSASDVATLARENGLGLSTVDAERVGLLTDTLYRRVNAGRMARGAASLRDLIPDVAAKIEQSYRVGVFRAALAAGEPPSQAAALARRSQVDWEAALTTPGADAALRWIPATAEWAATAAEVGAAMARNPGAYLRILRAQVAANRDWSEKYGIAPTDEVLAALPFPPTSVELPFDGPAVRDAQRQGLAFAAPASPLTAPVELAIDALRSVTSAGDLAAALVDLQRSLPERTAWGDRVAEAMLRIPGIVAAGGRAEGGSDQLRTLTDDEVYAGMVILAGAPSLLTAGTDADADDAFRAVQAILQPIPILPPGTPRGGRPADHPWTSRPPTGAWVIPGTRDGKPVWYAFTSSQQGLSNLAMIRAIAPDVLDRAAATGWAGLPAMLLSPVSPPPPEGDLGRSRIERLRASRQ